MPQTIFRSLLYMLLLFAPAVMRCGEVRDDTTHQTVIRPERSVEEKLFADESLKYDRVVEQAPGWFDRFIVWLNEKLRSIFGYNNIRTTRGIVIWSGVVIAAYVVIRLMLRSGLGGILARKPANTSFSFTDISEDISKIDFEQHVRDAVSSGNFRLAVRWRYLQSLSLLHDRNLIVFAPWKTNHDYNNELGAKELKPAFADISRIYEYVWYGEFVTGQTQYDRHETAFTDFRKQVNV